MFSIKSGASVELDCSKGPVKKKWRQTYFARPLNIKPTSILNPLPITQSHLKPNPVTSCVVYKDGDLFDSQNSLMHCVSADMRMGRGIAVTFRRKFGQVEDLLRQNVRPGGCAVLKDSNRFIYYLVTKQRCYEKPTHNSLEASLRMARDHCVKHNIDSISIPQIGCGLDGLRWKDVANLIESVFRKTNITITVYILNTKQ